MENLWPVELVTPLSAGEPGWEVFDAQAVAISQASRGLVHGEMRRLDSLVGRSSSMFLCPAGQPAKGYEFMTIRSEGADFPLAIEVFHLGESQRFWPAREASDAKRVLRKIFAHEATARVIRSLAEEAASLQTSGRDAQLLPATVAESPQQEESLGQSALESARPISVGGLILDSGTLFAAVNLLGVAGYVEEDELKRLVMKPDAKGSSIQTLNGRFVVRLSFLDSVRMTLSLDELKVLQNDVRRALSDGLAAES